MKSYDSATMASNRGTKDSAHASGTKVCLLCGKKKILGKLHNGTGVTAGEEVWDKRVVY